MSDRTKERIFDDFLTDLFSDNLDLAKIGVTSLDKSLLITSERKKQIQKVMMDPNTISSLKLRNAAGDLELSNGAFSFLAQKNLSSVGNNQMDLNLDQPELD